MMYCKNLSLIWKLILFSIFVLLAGCEKNSSPRYSGTIQEIPDEQSDSVTIITMNKELKTMELHAWHIDRFYDRKETYIDSLYLESFDEWGNLKSTLNCNTATIDESRNKVICEGEVVVHSQNGDLFTPRLTWFRDTDKVLAENGVKLVRGDDILWGERMRTDIELNDIEIVKVSAAGTVKDGAVEW